jgi:hypothetical protein
MNAMSKEQCAIYNAKYSVNEKELNIYKHKSSLQENFLAHIIHYTLFILLFIHYSFYSSFLFQLVLILHQSQKRNQISKNNEQLINV